jgi:type II secretory pathway pseudopilin PulG
MKAHRTDAGFSLAALIFFLTAASIFIAAAVPSYQMQAKRELEEELIFRGEEYTRAIQKYQRRFGVYPTSVDQLVSTNGLRFVRRAYKDPLNGKYFRLISINPDGTVQGSKIVQQNINNQPLFGNTQTFDRAPTNSKDRNRTAIRATAAGGGTAAGAAGGWGSSNAWWRLTSTPTSFTGFTGTKPVQQQQQQRGRPAVGTSPFGASGANGGKCTPVAMAESLACLRCRSRVHRCTTSVRSTMSGIQ